MTSVVISDASCLIALSRIGKLDILNQLFSSVLITEEVAAEFDEPLPDWIVIKHVEVTHIFEQLQDELDSGEASSIALALEIKDCLLIIDERKGRRVAATRGLNIIVPCAYC